VGLRTQFGAVTLGRQYTSSFLTVQNSVDPFAGESVAALRDIGMALQTSLTSTPITVNPGQIRVSDAVKYALTTGGFSFSADIAEAPAGQPDRPYSVGGSYTAGPFWAGLAYEDAGGADDNLLNLGARFTFGNVTLSGGYSDGDTNRLTAAIGSQKVKAWLVGANIAVGVGDIKVGYADLKVGNVKANERFGVGYHHNLSKRTKLYASYAYDSKGFHGAFQDPRLAGVGSPDLRNEKDAYDVGIQHNF
jgi:predicted porin